MLRSDVRKPLASLAAAAALSLFASAAFAQTGEPVMNGGSAMHPWVADGSATTASAPSLSSFFGVDYAARFSLMTARWFQPAQAPTVITRKPASTRRVAWRRQG
jgi:hypothetical protein